MTEQALCETIIEEMTPVLQQTEGERFNSILLASKVRGAIREVKTARNYPPSWSTETIESDLEKYYGHILKIAEYDYNQIGVEGQSSYSVDGESVSYVDRKTLFNGIVKIGRMS